MPYRIRLTTPQDIEAIAKLHAAQNQRDGTDYPLTTVFNTDGKRVVPLALTVVNGKEEIVQGIIVERTAELMLAGCDARATASLHKQIGGLFFLMAQKGYSGIHCLVPKKQSWWRRLLYRLASIGEVRGAIERPLTDVGFERDDHLLAHFYRDLREVER